MTQRTFTHNKLLRREACTHRSFYADTGKLLHRDREACTQRRGRFYSQQAFTQSKLLHTASSYTQQAFAQRSFYTERALYSEDFYTQQAFTHRSFYIEKPVHREAFTHSKLSHKEGFTQKSLHTESLKHRSFYTEKPLHSFYTQRASIQRGPYLTQRRFYTQQAFPERSFYTRKLLHTEAFSHTSLFAQRCQKLQLQNQTDLGAKATKEDFEALFKRNFKRKIINAKIENLLINH